MVQATTSVDDAPANGRGGSRLQLQLLGGFHLSDDCGSIPLPTAVSRLLALLAIEGRPMSRSYTANRLWMDTSEPRALANLRSNLWRLRRISNSLVEASATHLWLGPSVDVDLDHLREIARRLMMSEGRVAGESAIDSSLLCSELLPTWYDDFVEREREHLRQLRLHGLERLAEEYRARGDWCRALSLALTAVGCDPLRESAHRVAISVHLAEGNVSEALRQYRILHTALQRDLGIAPSSAATQLVSRWL